MSEPTRGALQRVPSLVSLSTIAMAADFQYECPSGMFSLLCAVTGSCTLIAGGENIHLVGSRMALIAGGLRYRMRDASPDLSVSRLDFSTSCGGVCGYGLAQISRVFPQAQSLMEWHGTCTEFEDSGAVILSSLRNLHSFSAFPQEQRNLQTALTLCAILGGISAAIHGQSSRRRCVNPHVRRALDYIEGNYMCAISTEDIAGAAGVHVGHLHRIFPEETGMTIGELARYLNETEGIGCALTVIPCKGVTRGMFFDDGDLPFVAPSPNLPSPDCALIYVGTCLFEGTNVSEGRGTTKPFELFGAPWLDSAALLRELNALAADGILPGCLFRETAFVPTFSKYAGEMCRGVQIHVTDRDRFLPFDTGVRALGLIRRLHPEEYRARSFLANLYGSGEILEEDFQIVLDGSDSRDAEVLHENIGHIRGKEGRECVQVNDDTEEALCQAVGSAPVHEQQDAQFHAVVFPVVPLDSRDDGSKNSNQ